MFPLVIVYNSVFFLQIKELGIEENRTPAYIELLNTVKAARASNTAGNWTLTKYWRHYLHVSHKKLEWLPIATALNILNQAPRNCPRNFEIPSTHRACRECRNEVYLNVEKCFEVYFGLLPSNKAGIVFRVIGMWLEKNMNNLEEEREREFKA